MRALRPEVESVGVGAVSGVALRRRLAECKSNSILGNRKMVCSVESSTRTSSAIQGIPRDSTTNRAYHLHERGNQREVRDPGHGTR